MWWDREGFRMTVAVCRGNVDEEIVAINEGNGERLSLRAPEKGPWVGPEAPGTPLQKALINCLRSSLTLIRISVGPNG